ncbi:hypothetical protein R1flu_027488 [Riccia fluitans]|uniref:Uncharacterized protein n=1 Tax=Riccia fluitans TaxID=41844 RepID=A0ABD1XIX8_9MARC
METLAANSQQPPEELVHEVTALEARRANLEATLTRMGSVEDPRPRPIQPEVPRQKVLILDLNGLLLRLCKGVAEAERAREFGHLPMSPVGSRMVYVPRVGVSSFLAEMAIDSRSLSGHRGRAAIRNYCSRTWRSVVSCRVVSSRLL